MAARFQVRSDVAQRWVEVDPVLQFGEVGAETDTRRMKVGDGRTPWSLLPYVPEVDQSLPASSHAVQDETPSWGTPPNKVQGQFTYVVPGTPRDADPEPLLSEIDRYKRNNFFGSVFKTFG